MEGHSTSALEVPHYLHDGGLDTNGKSVVVDWYYKKRNAEGRRVLHYCKFCNGVVLYASENDPEYAGRGFYDHGQYPFVFDPLFVEEDSPAGFGYIDVMKECQTAIDRMNHAMDENVLLSSKQRYVLSDAAGVNEEELADFSRDIVHVVGRLGDDSFRPLQTTGLQGNSLSYRNSRIEELKEISGNRDMTQGGTAGGVTAASAIAALWTTSSLTFFAGGVERIIAVVLHLSLSILVFQSIRKKAPMELVRAYLFHFVIDSLSVLLSAVASVWVVELVVALVTGGAVLMAKYACMEE